MRQHDIFWQGEGDAWYARNSGVLSPEEQTKDPVFKLLDEHVRLTKASSVLEVGAANGYRLAALHRHHECAVTAVEPSEQALENGRARFPEIRYIRGLGHQLADLRDSEFDLIIVYGVLCWVDRSMLLRTVAEIDRVLGAGGHLLVGDFLPDAPQRTKYHHLQDADVWTYKQAYAEMWLASNLYEKVASLTFHHSTKQINDRIESAHRFQACLLKKTLTGRYQTAELHR